MRGAITMLISAILNHPESFRAGSNKRKHSFLHKKQHIKSLASIHNAIPLKHAWYCWCVCSIMYMNYISINTPWISVILSFRGCYCDIISNIFYCGVPNALLSELCLIAFWAHSLFGAFSHVHLLPEVLSRAATCQKASGSRGPRKRGFVWRFQCI